MKWSKYTALAEKYPWIRETLRFDLWCIPQIRRGSEKDVVRKRVGFIAFRPFKNLTLQETSSSAGTVLPDKRYKYVVMEMFTRSDYAIYYEVAGRTGQYIIFADNGKTIQQCVDEAKAWFESCEEFRGHTLLFQRVVKKNLSSSSYSGITNVSFEIYEFPVGERAFQHPLKTEVEQVDRNWSEAMHAYVNDLPMPPIMPGS